MFTYQVGKRKRKTLQQTIHDDLSELASQFSEQWTETSNSSSMHTVTVGASFQLFLRIFQDGNVALVHTLGLPPRCDPESFAQVLYAACLQLVDLDDLPRAAFGIFSLYAFFQSSPLPSLKPPWQWLSMGLVHPDNPKLGYRRRFRQRIRIYRHDYAQLQQLRHLCLGHTKGQLAADVICILRRLEFDWCEYNGPRGVDALAAGIRDACFTISSTQALPSTEHAAELQGEAQEEEDTTLPTTIDALKDYHVKLQAIEVSSKSQQSKRVQTALHSLSGQDSWQGQIEKLTFGRTLQETESQDRVAVIDVPGRSDQNSISAPADHAAADAPTSYRLRLPPTISESLQRDITSAIKNLVKRGDNLLLPQQQQREDETEIVTQPVSIAAITKKDTFGRHDDFLTVQEEVQPHFDSDMSDVSDEEIQYVLDKVGVYSDGEDESAAGLGALNMLLKQAKPVAKKKRTSNRKQPKEDAISVADASVGRKALSSLLKQAKSSTRREEETGREAKKAPATNGRGDEVSVAASSVGRNALSSLLDQATNSPAESRSEDEEYSVAASSVGRNALSSLLKQVNEETNTKRRSTRRRKVADGVGVGRRALRDDQSSKNPPAKRNKSGDDEDSVAASSVGRNALSSLLDQATSSPAESRSEDEEYSVAASSVGRNALSSLLEQVGQVPSKQCRQGDGDEISAS